MATGAYTTGECDVSARVDCQAMVLILDIRILNSNPDELPTSKASVL
jgi:hypothetical protein